MSREHITRRAVGVVLIGTILWSVLRLYGLPEIAPFLLSAWMFCG